MSDTNHRAVTAAQGALLMTLLDIVSATHRKPLTMVRDQLQAYQDKLGQPDAPALDEVAVESLALQIRMLNSALED